MCNSLDKLFAVLKCVLATGMALTAVILLAAVAGSVLAVLAKMVTIVAPIVVCALGIAVVARPGMD